MTKPTDNEAEDASRAAAAFMDADDARKDDRDPECVAAWPGCHSFGYDPRCCRFPKSCSANRPPADPA